MKNIIYALINLKSEVQTIIFSYTLKLGLQI